MLKIPRDIKTCPRPPHVAQVFNCEPVSAPEPSHVSHLSSFVTEISPFAAERGFFERDFQIVTQIVAALRSRRVLVAAKEIFKNASTRAAAENSAKNIKRIVKAARAAATAARALARVERRVAELVVGRAFLRRRSTPRKPRQFLEFFLGVPVAGIFVGMIFDGETAVGFFDAVGGFLAGDFKDFVVVALCHEKFRVANSGLQFGRRTFGDDDSGGTQQSFAQLVALAKLLDDVAFWNVGGFLLRNRFVQRRVK